ncbi:MAG: hypothetical protein JNL95_12345 [Chitinophagales bacterium]|nr:hypothetical protein [Chitinophagales bacterium]
MSNCVFSQNVVKEDKQKKYVVSYSIRRLDSTHIFVDIQKKNKSFSKNILVNNNDLGNEDDLVDTFVLQKSLLFSDSILDLHQLTYYQLQKINEGDIKYYTNDYNPFAYYTLIRPRRTYSVRVLFIIPANFQRLYINDRYYSLKKEDSTKEKLQELINHEMEWFLKSSVIMIPIN